MFQDLRAAMRALRRRPGFTLLAISNLGLGIAASTVVWSLVYGVLFRPLPYRAGDRMVIVSHRFGEHGQDLPAIHPLDVRDYRERSRLIEDFTILGGREWILGEGEDAEVVDAGIVAANFFPFLGVDPAIGRHFHASEDAAGGPPVVLIGYELWSRRFGSDPGAVGRSLDIDGRRHEVVGVLPEGFGLLLPPEAFWLRNAQIWKPLQLDYAKLPPRNFTTYSALARLRPEVTLEQAQAEMSALAARLRAEHPVHAAASLSVRLTPFREHVVKGARDGLMLLLAAVGFVLATACLNVAILLLARGRSHEAEFMLRAALGASRVRIARGVLAEGIVLAAGGAGLGLLLASAGLALAVRAAPPFVPRLDAVALDGPVLALVAGAAALATLCFGVWPAWCASRDLDRGLRDGGRLTATPAQTRSLALLVGGQVALAFVLVAGTGSAIQALRALASRDPGFDPRDVLTLRLTLPERQYPGDGPKALLFSALKDRIEALQGVRGVAAVNQLPLTGSGPPQPFAYDATTARNWETLTAEWRRVSPGFFTTVGARLIEGRDFLPEDVGTAPRIVVDETLARMAFRAVPQSERSFRLPLWERTMPSPRSSGWWPISTWPT